MTIQNFGEIPPIQPTHLQEVKKIFNLNFKLLLLLQPTEILKANIVLMTIHNFGKLTPHALLKYVFTD